MAKAWNKLMPVVTVLRAGMVEIDVVIKDPPNRFSKANTVSAVSFTKKIFSVKNTYLAYTQILSA